MRFSVALSLLIFVSYASAQNIPPCALTCISSANTTGCAGPTDTACLCQNQALINSTLACLQQGCPSSDIQAALSAAQALCARVSVSLSVPAGASATPTGSSNSSASAAPTTSSTSGNGALGLDLSVIASIIGAGVVALVL
ncbi:hypothetical protein L218DRAFT_953490 [Marasmius fiardii PR-910]|nr:hypothetical protein L218DRAFT_953490 [Marasmius fiardii PR-910]